MTARSHEVLRGNAIPETVIMMTFIFMLMLGATRLAIVGYAQAQADGATYIAAHSLARDSSATTSTVDTIVKTIFPSVKTTGSPSLSMGSGSGQTYADYEPSLSLRLVPGVTSTIKIRSHAVEANLSAVSSVNGSNNIYVPLVTMKNYVDGEISGIHGTTGSYPFYVAQFIYINGNGNGAKATFYEWNCHYSEYSTLMGDLPSTYPGNNYNITGSLLSDEKKIYGWDSTTPGASSSCP